MPTNNQEAIAGRLWLMWDQAAPWEDVVPYINQFTPKRLSMSMANGFALLYLHRQRVPEALAAAQNWIDAAKAWINQHPAEATEALQLYKKSYFWYLRPQQRGYKLAKSRQKKNFSDKDRELTPRINALGGSMVKEYRDAHLAILMMHWYQGHITQDAASHSLESTEKEINPLFPTGGHLDYDLALRMGMTGEEFDVLCKSAEQW